MEDCQARLLLPSLVCLELGVPWPIHPQGAANKGPHEHPGCSQA